MLSGVAIIPSAPVLVPELAGAAAAETADLRAAVLAAAATLPSRWLVIGGGVADGAFGPDATGTFAGFGADVVVRLSPGEPGPPGALPPAVLVAGWVRGHARPDACATAEVFAGDRDPNRAVAAGRALRAEIDRTPEPVGVLVVADGANTLTPAAPGGYRPGDTAVQNGLDAALTGGDVDALACLPAQILGRIPFAVLAGLTGTPPRAATELYGGAPYGVGYFVGVWAP